MTATGVPSRASTTVDPRPGAASWKFAGRTTDDDDARYGPISSRRHVWFPSVTASAPAASSRSASRGVIPRPFAMFSPLTTHDVDLETLPERREQPFDRVAAGTSDDVPDEQQAHG